MIFVVIATMFIYLLDQGSKYYFYKNVLPGTHFFSTVIIDHSWNTGISYSWGAGISPAILTTIVVLLTSVTGAVLWRERYYAGFSCIVGGALGNIHDRLYYGAVFDFISLKWGEYYWPTVFNIADIFIIVGGLLVLKDLLWSKV